MEQMFDIVAQVEKYNEFVPWCTHSTVYHSRPGFLNCKLAVGFPPIEERYNSAVTLHKPYMVKVCCKICVYLIFFTWTEFLSFLP